MTQSNRNNTPLVSTQWVAEHLNDPNVIIVELNTDLAAGYNQAHIPGAAGWDVHVDIEDQLRRDVPNIAQFEQLMGRSGIDNATTVVLYGDGRNRSATWAFWVLKYYSHSDVRLMNGGRDKWLADGLPTTTDLPARPARVYRAGAPDRSLRAMRDYVLQNLGNPSFKLLDTRTTEEFNGQSRPGHSESDIYRKGRIPGALHVPWDEAVGEDGGFKPLEELRSLYAGFLPKQEIISYCRLGIRASYSWFVLSQLLGYPRVRVYDGSWTEWGNSSGVPIER
ncbi:MAG: sulfurtransferase [SAR202 cluster bacterium]|nr:sulfurtransferase [SAR202 cluster bacterium]